VICLAAEDSSTDGDVPFIAESWNFNEGSGTVATDISWNGHHGTVENATWADGALDFNGADASVSIPVAVFANASHEVTIAMKIYGGETQPANDKVFYTEDAAGKRVISIQLPYVNTDGATSVICDMGNLNGSSDRLRTAITTDQFMGQWNHWVFTKDTVAGTMAIYLNGMPFYDGVGNMSTMTGVVSAHIGSADGNSYYDGMMDDVQVYNACLSATEVYDLYHLDAPSTTYSSWVTSQSLVGADAEPSADTGDGDGLSNVVESWLGTNPKERDSGVFKVRADSTTTTITHPRNANMPEGLSGLYEWSENLVDWYECNGSDGPAGGYRVTATPVTEGTTTTVTIDTSEIVDHAFVRIGVKKK
jgi:hypothetical protein